MTVESRAGAEPDRFAPAPLRAFAEALFRGAGMDDDKAATVASILVEADLMGHTTHGLALAPRYLEEIAAGSMTPAGEPGVVSDRGACVVWDGRRLPGVWLTAQAVDLALERVGTYGTVTAAIGNSHHIGCLAAYLTRATDRGCMILISCSDPSQRTVAPFGGTRGLLTPDPIAVGIPTDGDPILVDASTSLTTNNLAARLAREGRRLPDACLIDPEGRPSDDPAVLARGGSILPVGGLENGQKGYGLGLMVEALSQGLAGFGRADGPGGWGACVFVQVIDPGAFAGAGAFTRQTTFLAEACRENPPRPGVERVRLPGEGGLRRKRDALARGVALHPGVLDKLVPFAARFGVPVPVPAPARAGRADPDGARSGSAPVRDGDRVRPPLP